jgi:beta-phosphoglucomutase-like phosphatase (HAD superfamily)
MAPGAVVFDFDGVLANSEPLHLRAYQKVLHETGLELEREEYYASYLGFDDVGAFKAIGEARRQHWTDQRIAELVARKTLVFDELFLSGHVLYPAAPACVERLAARFPLGIASGALRHEIESVLRNSGLDRHIRFVVASGDTPRSKPAPDPYTRAAALHGIAPALCVAIEDSRWGIESAKGAGLRCVGITQTYPAAELASADAVIDSLDEFTVDLIEELIAGV